MYKRSLRNDGHTRRFQIIAAGQSGWEVREEQDSHVVRAKIYDDWHRVERARTFFQAEVITLEKAGWVEVN